MKWSFAIIGVFILGLIGVSIIFLFQQITTNNENDYYLLKEVTEAAMIDSIDIGYYRDTGDLKIIKEKFVENFTRRFAESTLFVTNEYTVDFYNIMETPPKVSIVINTDTGEYTVNGNADDYKIANKLDAILEYTGKNTFSTSYAINPYNQNKTVTSDVYYYAILSDSQNEFQFSLKIPDILNVSNIKNVKIKEVKNIEIGTTQGDLNQALLRNELSYNNVKTDNYLYSIEDYNKKANKNNIIIDYYNCKNNGDNGDYNCKNDNRYYLNINRGKNSGDIIIKYKIVWLYDEYEFVS